MSAQTIKAAVLERPNEVVWRDVPEPHPASSRWVKVRIGAVGVCGSDVLRYAHATAYQYPLVLGHEFSGTVEEVSDGSRLTPGDKVAVFPLLPRAEDPHTQIGEWALGTDYDYFGLASRRRHAGGALGPRGESRARARRRPLVHAAVVEPAAVALHAILKLTVPADGTALVIGAGPIGGLAAQWLRILGWTRVIVADVDERKCEIMRGLGFEVIAAGRSTPWPPHESSPATEASTPPSRRAPAADLPAVPGCRRPTGSGDGPGRPQGRRHDLGAPRSPRSSDAS